MFAVTIFSYLIKPMFYQRYVVVFLGCLWLSFSIMLNVLSKYRFSKVIVFPVILMIVIMGVTNTVSFVNSQDTLKSSYLDFEDCMSYINTNDTVILFGSPAMTNFYIKDNTNVIVYNSSNISIYNTIEETMKNNNVYIFCMTSHSNIEFSFYSQIEEKYTLQKIKDIKSMSNSYPTSIFKLQQK